MGVVKQPMLAETYRQTKECVALELQAFKGKAELVAAYRLISCK